MKLNKLILISSGVVLTAGMAILAETEVAGSRWSNPFAKAQKESGETEEIQGALESIYSLRLNERTGTIEPEWFDAAVAQVNNRVSSRGNTLKWTNMGPDNVGGRIRAFLIHNHKDSGHVMFAGSVSGGLFRSRTNGQSWVPVVDPTSNLSITCIAQTPDGTIYYGTGEGGFTNLGGTRNGSPAFPGNGVYKSTSTAGNAYTNLANTISWSVCNAMVAHPTENWLWVSNGNGIFRTADGGANWTRISTGVFRDMVVDKDGFIWCTNSSGRVFKGNADGTAITVFNGITTGGRTSIAVSPQDPQYVYLLGSDDRFLTGVWRTTNGGANWDLLVSKTEVTEIFGTGQGYYDNCIAVDPLNKNRVYLGGVDMAMWDTDNGFRQIASTFDAPWNASYVHADKHLITFNTRTNPPTMIVGSDGGLAFSTNRSVWTQMNRNFFSYQAYNVAANYLGHVAGGSQDNGTQLINFTGNAFNGEPSKNALEIYGGDGFDVEFSKFKPSTIFMSTYYGRIARTANNGQSNSTFWDKRLDGTSQTDFNTTFSLWEKDATTSRLFLAKDADVWCAVNPTDFSNPVEWFLIASGTGNTRIIEMDHTPDGNHVFVAKPGALWRIDSLNKATFSSTMYPGARDIPAGITKRNIMPAAASGRTVTSVNVDMANAAHVVITLGGYGNNTYVYETDNALDDVPTWKNITGDLPSIPVYDAVIDPDNANRIIIGTDFGIYMTVNGGSNWTEENTGMARVPVFEIRGYEFNPWEGMVMYIGTHGRGFFRCDNFLTNTKKVTKSQMGIQAYPNPARDQFNLSFTAAQAGKASIQVYNLRGEVVRTLNVQATTGNNVVEISTSDLNSGYYFAKVVQGTSTASVKFAVTQ
jgi:Secretion system C-terminal sorting domain